MTYICRIRFDNTEIAQLFLKDMAAEVDKLCGSSHLVPTQKLDYAGDEIKHVSVLVLSIAISLAYLYIFILSATLLPGIVAN